MRFSRTIGIKDSLFLVRAQELCESRGGRPGLAVSNSPCGLCGRKATLNWNSPELVQGQSLAGFVYMLPFSRFGQAVRY